jgi:hypothetical protein
LSSARPFVSSTAIALVSGAPMRPSTASASYATARSATARRIAQVRTVADIVECQVEEETRAVDHLLVAYNAEIARMNLQFERLVAMLRAVEKKVKPS